MCPVKTKQETGVNICLLSDLGRQVNPFDKLEGFRVKRKGVLLTRMEHHSYFALFFSLHVSPQRVSEKKGVKGSIWKTEISTR